MFFRKRKPDAGPRYALCERVTATGTSPHHIRELTDVGMKPSGGADTLALCGAKVAWDTSEILLSELPDRLAHQHESYWYCSGCVEAVEQLEADCG